MAKDRSLVRASDIGSWTFCRRAWWLANVKDVPHQNPAVLQRGDVAHAHHGRQVALSLFMRWAGIILLLLAALILVLYGLITLL